jgi:hypothetical protein
VSAVQRLRELVDANELGWIDDRECVTCGQILNLLPELEPRGLCNACLEELAEQVPLALAELEAEVALLTRKNEILRDELDQARGGEVPST